MTQSVGTLADATPSTASEALRLEQAVRARIEGMSYLPTTVAVAMKFVQLGRDPDADPADYTKVISSDSSLSTKLLSLANSSWFGVRNKVTRVQVAVNLLGLSTVRTLAISYCVTGLHNELRLSAEESRMFWCASLCKAVAARCLASPNDPKLGDEAFAAALFQDFAQPVMFATARHQMGRLLQDAGLDWQARLEAERAIFRLDHAELGRSIAQKLELPDIFVDAIAFHHNRQSLHEFLGSAHVADAVYLASLFTHMPNVWNRQDAIELRQFLADRAINSETFLSDVQSQFNQLYGYFEQGQPPEQRLTELLELATREIADSTTRLVGTVQQLLNQASSAGRDVQQLLKQQTELEQAATRDPLTGALNRDGFQSRATELLAQAGRYGFGLALVYLDLDRFKQLNDTMGHACGDEALKAVVNCIRQNCRQNDVVGRLGGDEFVLLLPDCGEEDACLVVSRVLENVANTPLARRGKPPIRLTLSAGIVYVQKRTAAPPLDELLEQADALMYESKRAGGNRASRRRLMAA